MNTFKRAKVVRLSTTDDSHIFIHPEEPDKLRYFDRIDKSISPFINQHLYFITDDEIKEDNWVIADDNKLVYITCIVKYSDNKKEYSTISKEYYFNCKKVVCSTNSSLNLPKPSQSFIKKYCEKGGINEVMIKYTTKGRINLLMEYVEDIVIKVDKNNEITIKAVQDTFTKEEVINIIIEYGKSFEEDFLPHQYYTNIREWFNSKY